MGYCDRSQDGSGGRRCDRVAGASRRVVAEQEPLLQPGDRERCAMVPTSCGWLRSRNDTMTWESVVNGLGACGDVSLTFGGRVRVGGSVGVQQCAVDAERSRQIQRRHRRATQGTPLYGPVGCRHRICAGRVRHRGVRPDRGTVRVDIGWVAEQRRRSPRPRPEGDRPRSWDGIMTVSGDVLTADVKIGGLKVNPGGRGESLPATGRATIRQRRCG